MEQRLERALITMIFFGFVAVATVAGFVAAVECGFAAVCCFLATGWVQRRAPDRRFAGASRKRRKYRGLDPKRSRPTTAARRRSTRPTSPAITSLVLDADELAAEPISGGSYGW
jgi:hypothetical protein